MPNQYETGVLWTTTLPSWQRDYYSLLLMETLRTRSIFVPYCTLHEDFSEAKSGRIVHTEVFDTEPNWNALSESGIWLDGAHLDSRTVVINLEIHGDMLKFSDYGEIVQYINSGNMRGLVREKIGQNQTDYLDILARNAFLSHPSPKFIGATSRTDLAADDLFDPDYCETARVHLEENDVPGVAGVSADDIQTIVCITSPRVIKDIRTAASSNWLEVNQYVGTTRKFTGEVGMWAGVRFVKSNRLRLRNYGAVITQTTLAAAAPAGSGAAQTVDAVYTVGQSGSTRYVTVDSVTGFAVGQYVTIHKGTASNPPNESDGSQETRRIVSIDTTNKRLSFDKPLLKDHDAGDLVTNGRDIHASIFIGGPGVVYAVGERPHVIMPPKIDDLMMVNRIGWRGFLKFQLYRPEFFEVVFSAGSTD